MKRKGILLIYMVGLFFVSCEKFANKELSATIYVSIPKNSSSYTFSHLVNNQSLILNGSNTRISGKIVEKETEINSFLTKNFPNSKIWEEDTMIVRYSFKETSLKSNNNSFKIIANIDDEEYVGEMYFGYLSTDRVYDGISEFREIALENSNGKKLNALFVYYYHMWI